MHFLPVRHQPGCCVLATPASATPTSHIGSRAVHRNATTPSRRQSDVRFYGDSQEFRPPPPPQTGAPPPPPIFDDGSYTAQEQESKSKMLVGIGIACLTALGFIYGFQDDNAEALRAARNLPPLTRASSTATDARKQQQLSMESFPTTIVPGEVPVGMQSQWAHQWRYDENGQPYIKLQERWWRLQRPAGGSALVYFFDVQNQFRPGLQYVYTAPNDWPLDEIDLCNQQTMALLFGQETELEDRLQALE